MILYKNVDLIDLESIMTKGILSMNESGNKNWDYGKRADNSSDVVYLFSPLTKFNSFTQYGTVLLEVNIPEDKAIKSDLDELDINSGKYIEYTISKVSPEQINAAYVPEIFKQRIPEELYKYISWCGIKARSYGEYEKEDCTDDVLNQFASTAEIMAADEYNFFRGVDKKKEVFDLYDIEYIIEENN